MATTEHTPMNPMPGVSTMKFAMWLFLASEALFFAGLISAYVLLRITSPSWPDVSELLNVPLVAVNTSLLLISSVTMVYGFASIEDGNQSRLRLFLIATAGLGTIFVGIQAVEWAQLIGEGVSASNSVFGSTFYVLTGFHGLHVVIGILFLVLTIYRASRGRYSQAEHDGVELMGLYWHFVDIVWIFLFTVIYLI
jgi:heme/copper-type cytochrome/quinol oxidase subunit 3